MSNDPTTFAHLQTDVAVLKTRVDAMERTIVDHAAVAQLLEPVREEQRRQGVVITELAQKMGTMADANEQTNKKVQTVLERFEDSLKATADAELARAKMWSIGNVLAKSTLVLGSLVTISGGMVLLYAIAKWVLTRLP